MPDSASRADAVPGVDDQRLGAVRRARFCTLASLRWIVRHRAWTPYYLRRYLRFFLFRLRHREVITEGFVFLGRNVDVQVRRGYGRLILGRWAHLGDGTSLRAHEGTLRIGAKSVLGSRVTVNCYLDVEVGEAALVADDVYLCDFDHVTDDPDVAVKDQGIVKSPVRIGPGGWIGTKVTVTRGTYLGRGVVVGANSVVRGDVPDDAIIAGVPATLVKDRRAAYAADAERREYLAGLARGAARARDEAAQRFAAGED